MCMYICIYIYIYTPYRLTGGASKYLHPTNVYGFMCMGVYTYTHTHTQIQTQTRTHTYTREHTRTRTHHSQKHHLPHQTTKGEGESAVQLFISTVLAAF